MLQWEVTAGTGEQRVTAGTGGGAEGGDGAFALKEVDRFEALKEYRGQVLRAATYRPGGGEE